MGPYLVVLFQLIGTILIEGSVMIVWRNSVEDLGYSVLVNLMTNPPLNLILMYLSWHGTGLYETVMIKILLEIAVVMIEAVAYMGMMKTDIKKAVLISLVLNLVSFGVGEFFGAIGMWKVLDVIAAL